MRKILYILSFICLISCDSENTGDCFQSAGKIIQTEFEVPPFKNILIHTRVALFIEEGPVQKVVVETGENLLSDISVEVVNDEVIVVNNNKCNLVRDYGITKVYITSPNIYRIRNASELNVTSIGTLTYASMYLLSLGDKNKFLAVGDYHVNIENEKVKIWSNGIATMFVSGSTNNLDINYSNGDPRFEGQEFRVKNIKVKQISSNDMLLFPTESITGSVRSTGDVILYNKPATIAIETPGVGKVIVK